MRTVSPLFVAAMTAGAALLAACTGARGNGWVDLNTGAGDAPTLHIVGTVHRLEIESGVSVIRDAQGTSYQPTNLPEAFRKEGMLVEAVARRADAVASIGMSGTLVDLARIRERTQGAHATVTGTVAYRERMALPEDAIVLVQLADVSRQDVPAVVVAETTVDTKGRQVPIPFELTYDPALISANREYRVRATIREGANLVFTTTSAYPAITRGNPSHIDLLLQRVSEPMATPSLRGSSWVLTDLGGTPVIDGVQATLAFADDGSVSGNASCNQFRGASVVTGTTISFGPLATTRKACAGSAMEQEQQYLNALGAAKQFEVRGSSLYIHSDGRPQPLHFVASKDR